jgi:hypothetical protein
VAVRGVGDDAQNESKREHGVQAREGRREGGRAYRERGRTGREGPIWKACDGLDGARSTLESTASRSNTSNSKELVPVSTKSNCTRLKVKGAEGS